MIPSFAGFVQKDLIAGFDKTKSIKKCEVHVVQCKTRKSAIEDSIDKLLLS